jgi:hypothetical protein
MIWTDERTGRHWDVRAIGRTGGPILSDPEDWRRRILPQGVIVLVFQAVGQPSESRIVSGAPEDWATRPDKIAQLFDEANRRR